MFQCEAKKLGFSLLARDVIYTARAYAMMPVRLSFCLSVTEVHWRIIANLGFKFRSHFTAIAAAVLLAGESSPAMLASARLSCYYMYLLDQKRESLFYDTSFSVLEFSSANCHNDRLKIFANCVHPRVPNGLCPMNRTEAASRFTHGGSRDDVKIVCNYIR